MPSFKNVIKGCAGYLFKSTLLCPAFSQGIRVILMYHRVTERLPEGLYDPSMIVTSSTFEMHVNTVSQFFDIVSLETIVRIDKKRGRQCAITFDDGWRDTYEGAFPILKKYGIPATVFLPSALIGSKHWFWFESLWRLANKAQENGSGPKFVKYFEDQVPSWTLPGIGGEHLSRLTSELKTFPPDRLDALMVEAYMSLGLKPSAQRIIVNWDEVVEMGRNGITFGPHGLKHQILPPLDYHSKREEVFSSLEILRNKHVPISPFFGYPNGDWDDESLAIVSEAGYHGAVTSRIGYNTPETHPYLLNRVCLHEYISHTPYLFWSRILQAVLAGSGHRSGNAIM